MKKLAYVLMCWVGVSASLLYGANAVMVSDTGTSAKMIGIGRIQGFDDTAAVISENPAGLYRLKGVSLFSFFATSMDDTGSQHIGIASKTPYGNVGLSFFQTKISNNYVTGKDGSNQAVVVSTFDYANTALKLAYAYTPDFLPAMHVGAALDYYASDFYDQHGRGYNIDAGVLWDADPLLQVSLVGKNILWGSMMTYQSGSRELLPVQVILGTRYNLSDITVYGQVSRRQNELALLKAAGAYYQPKFFNGMSVSAGYSEFYVLNAPRAKLSVGVGLNVAEMQIHFAFEKSDYAAQDNQYFMSFNVDI
jgi:hypothetical protein